MPALAPVSFSPDVDVFETPPTTPMTSEPSREAIIRPSLSRRPSNLHISQTEPEFRPDILIESQSPPINPSNKYSAQATTSQPVNGNVLDSHATTNGHSNSHLNGPRHDTRSEIPTITTTAVDSILPSQTLATSPDSVVSAPPPRSHTHSQSPIMSPCFVHSNLDKGASFSEWLKNSHGFPPIDVAPALQPMFADMPKAPRRHRKLDNGHVIPIPYEDDNVETVFDASDHDYEDDEGSASLTKQLAETAFGVREMSKQLGAFEDLIAVAHPAEQGHSGRTRIKSNIQNVLIVTKARDNRLIALTRALALYFMKKPRYNGRGLVVCVCPTVCTPACAGDLTCTCQLCRSSARILAPVRRCWARARSSGAFPPFSPPPFIKL
jgi:NAD+ kinase